MCGERKTGKMNKTYGTTVKVVYIRRLSSFFLWGKNVFYSPHKCLHLTRHAHSCACARTHTASWEFRDRVPGAVLLSKAYAIRKPL